jgi:hypothetical protein
MKDRHTPFLLVGLGLAAVGGLGLAFGAGPPLVWTGLAVVGAVLALAAQHRMARLPEEDED